MTGQKNGMPTWLKVLLVVLGLGFVLVVSLSFILISWFAETAKKASDPKVAAAAAKKEFDLPDHLPPGWSYVMSVDIGAMKMATVRSTDHTTIQFARYTTGSKDSVFEGQIAGALREVQERGETYVGGRSVPYVRGPSRTGATMATEMLHYNAPSGDLIVVQAMEPGLSIFDPSRVEAIFSLVGSQGNGAVPPAQETSSSAGTDSGGIRYAKPVMDNTADLPKDYLLDAQRLSDLVMRENFVRFNIQPPQDHPLLRNYVVVPKDWQGAEGRVSRQEFASASEHPCQLAELQCDSPHVSIEAWFTQPPKDSSLSLEQYFEKYAGSMGFTVLERKMTNHRLKALVKYDTKSVKGMLAQFTFVRVGKNIFWLCGCAPSSDYPKFSKAFRIASSTFTPVNATPLWYPEAGSRNLPSMIDE